MALTVTHASPLASSFQRVLVATLQNPDSVWFPSASGTTLTFVEQFGPGLEVVFRGVGLGLDRNGLPFGTITGFEIGAGFGPPDLTGGGVAIDMGALWARAQRVADFDGPAFQRVLDLLGVRGVTETGSTGDDVFDNGPKGDVLRGGAGNDLFLFRHVDPAPGAPQPPADLLVGGLGARDTLEIAQVALGFGQSLVVDLAQGRVERVTEGWHGGRQLLAEVRGIEDVVGTGYGDSILGDGARNLLRGQAGDDQMNGRAGADVLDGGWGRDTLLGGGGSDRLLGGAGADLLKGGAGRDRLFGGGHADRLEGGAGDDILTGGAGADVFVFDARSAAPGQGDDVITDFDAAQDRLLWRADFPPPFEVEVTIIGAGTLISHAGGTITLAGVLLTAEEIEMRVVYF